MLSDDDLQAMVAAEYLALGDLLEELPASRWNTPSLCEGWRVREVVAHLTMPARYSEAEFMAELKDSDFDFGRLSDRIAERDARLPTSTLVSNVFSEVLHNWQPPGGGPMGALNHVVIHGLDITVPLGLQRRSPDATIRIILDSMASGGAERFGVDISGVTLTATDLRWSAGTGPARSEPAENLVLYMAGRTLPSGARS
jgi:uncharacterized protein (TIGR03083 family)